MIGRPYQIIGSALGLSSLPLPDLVEGVREEVDRALRGSGLGSLEDEPVVTVAGAHLGNGLTDMQLAMLKVEVLCTKSECLADTQRTRHRQK